MDIRHAKGVHCKQVHAIEVIKMKDVNCLACKKILRENQKIREVFEQLEIEENKRMKRLLNKKSDKTLEQRKIETITTVTKHICPLCKSHMIIRKNNTTGEAFLGCTKYPHCKGTINPTVDQRRGRGDNYQMPFGKHKGKALKNIPFKYLRWLSEQEYSPEPVKRFVERHQDYI